MVPSPLLRNRARNARPEGRLDSDPENFNAGFFFCISPAAERSVNLPTHAKDQKHSPFISCTTKSDFSQGEVFHQKGLDKK